MTTNVPYSRPWPTTGVWLTRGGWPHKPALVCDDDQGGAIEVEVWALPEASVGSFLAAIPPPLGPGSVELADGSGVTGFICEGQGADAAEEITALGGWRAYIALQ